MIIYNLSVSFIEQGSIIPTVHHRIRRSYGRADGFMKGRSLKVGHVEPVQTTNLLLQAGEEALSTDPEHIAELAPLRYAQASHHLGTMLPCSSCTNLRATGARFEHWPPGYQILAQENFVGHCC